MFRGCGGDEVSEEEEKARERVDRREGGWYLRLRREKGMGDFL